MSEFKRAEPIEVPEDWVMQTYEMEARVGKKANALYNKLGHLGANAEMQKQPIILRPDDVLAYFETILVTDSIVEHWRNYSSYYDAGPLEKIPNLEWGRMAGLFETWWILTRFDVNGGRLDDMGGKYFLSTSAALIEYFHKSGDVGKAYEIMYENMKRYGFDMGDGNG